MVCSVNARICSAHVSVVRLSAIFFASDVKHPPAKTANAIIPISNLSPNMANYVSVPPAFSASVLVHHLFYLNPILFRFFKPSQSTSWRHMLNYMLVETGTKSSGYVAAI
jgi:hypothetical protein